MKLANLKILATAYDANAEMVSFAIGIGSKWIGSIKRKGRFFEASIGPAQGEGFTPETAARQAWIAFCDWRGPACGLRRPGAVDIDPNRISLRSTSPIAMDIYVGEKVSGQVVKFTDGRYRATIEGVEKTGVCAMAAARLAWIKLVSQNPA